MAKIVKINLMPDEFKNRLSYPRTITKIFISIAVLGLVFVSYFALIGYKLLLNNQIKEIQTQVQSVQDEISGFSGAQNSEPDKELVLIKLIKKNLSDHIYWTNFFEKLEQVTLPMVQFSDFSGNAENKTVSMKGKTVSYTTMAQQMAIFNESQDFFSKNIFSGIAKTSQGNISFDLELILSDSLLRPNKKNEY